MQTQIDLAKKALDRAISIAKSQSGLARKVGVKPQEVQRWVREGRVSRTRCLDVEKHTGVPREELRPDVYPAKDAAGCLS